MTSPKATPMMAQWAKCKDRVGEALLLFRLGDFYEAFGEDARVVSQALDLTLTKRQETPMCGIPWHSSDGYIDRLLVKGFSVAIAEQMGAADEAKEGAKPLMDRQIVRILTPGTVFKTAPALSKRFLSLSRVTRFALPSSVPMAFAIQRAE